MFRNQITYRPTSEQLNHQFLQTENSLGIGNLTFIWDQDKNQLVLMMDTNQMIGSDIKALLKGNRLILEAPLISSYNKPFRTHLLGHEFRDEFEEGFSVIAFSEVKLKYGYTYHLVSCQAIDPKMIKVVLGFSVWGRDLKN